MAADRMKDLEAATSKDEERINFYRRGSRGRDLRFAKDLLRGRGERDGGPVY